MALVVEDGSGKSDANAFVSVAYVDQYMAQRPGSEAWTALTDEPSKEAVIIHSTLRLHEERWLGYPRKYLNDTASVSDTQALAWPRGEVPTKDRRGVYAWDVIPEFLERATAELCLTIAADTDFLSDNELAQFSKLAVGRQAVDMEIRAGWKGGRLPETVRREIQHAQGASENQIAMVRG